MSNGNGSHRILYSVKDASYLLSVSVGQVRKWIAAGILPLTQVPHESGIGKLNRHLIHEKDLQEFAMRFRQASK